MGEIMEDKYIDLLINKCTELQKTPVLFVSYSSEIESFIEKLVYRVKELGVEDIYLDKRDKVYIHDFLKNSTIEEIKESSLFDGRIWDTYVEKKASFLMFETPIPHLMDDIDSEKIGLSSRLLRESKPLYRKMLQKCELAWCIAAYPGQKWADDLFEGDDSYAKLEHAIYKMCMVDQDNPIAGWDEHLEKVGNVMNYLNRLKLKKLHYSNSLGTDLELSLPEGYLFSSAKDREMLVNMPSYEVFASPCYDKTEGIVYSSMPLVYNGVLIDKFWLKFEAGKVVDFDAKVGKDILREIINIDGNCCYLGECALVEKNSPIAQMNQVFGTTLIDENASCHLALGSGFAECLEGGIEMSEEEILQRGVNVSHGHVDFMIGTADLKIIGITETGEEIPIFTDGNFDNFILDKVL